MIIAVQIARQAQGLQKDFKKIHQLISFFYKRISSNSNQEEWLKL
jgi:hypothetical protein